MYLKTAGIQLIVREETEARLDRTCFRGKIYCCAGNFFAWSSASDMFEDKELKNTLIDDIEQNVRRGKRATQRLTITLSDHVGWESTDLRSKYDESSFEPFTPNCRSSGLRLKLGYVHLKAPKTKDVTITYELKMENGVPTAVIHSIYPGVDIGALDGDVTERTGRIFFEWNHIGE